MNIIVQTSRELHTKQKLEKKTTAKLYKKEKSL